MPIGIGICATIGQAYPRFGLATTDQCYSNVFGRPRHQPARSAEVGKFLNTVRAA
jgi:hypothetical protein